MPGTSPSPRTWLAAPPHGSTGHRLQKARIQKGIQRMKRGLSFFFPQHTPGRQSATQTTSTARQTGHSRACMQLTPPHWDATKHRHPARQPLRPVNRGRDRVLDAGPAPCCEPSPESAPLSWMAGHVGRFSHLSIKLTLPPRVGHSC